MFDFEKLEVYKKAKTFNAGIRVFLKDENILEIAKHNEFYQQAEELSKIIFAMIKNLSK